MTVLLMDVGATSIKWTYADSEWERTRRRATPRPLFPEMLVAFVAHRVRLRNCQAVGVAFPGAVADGVIVDAANVTRPLGPGTAPSPELSRAWTQCDLAALLRRELSIPVVILNDAFAVARSSDVTDGRHLFVVLGTGCGVGLRDGGETVAIRDFGDDWWRGMTLDEAVGERAREVDEERWRRSLIDVIHYLTEELAPDVVHLAGGNARRLRPTDIVGSVPVVIDRDVSAVRGVYRYLTESS